MFTHYMAWEKSLGPQRPSLHMDESACEAAGDYFFSFPSSSHPGFCLWVIVCCCWGVILVGLLPEDQAGLLVAVQPLVLALVILEIRDQLLQQAAWGAWDRSENSWADQKAEMFFWQPWGSLSWFMNSICSTSLAKETQRENMGCLFKQEWVCGFREPPSTKKYHLYICRAIAVQRCSSSSHYCAPHHRSEVWPQVLSVNVLAEIPGQMFSSEL